MVQDGCAPCSHLHDVPNATTQCTKIDFHSILRHCLHGLLPAPLLLSYSVFDFNFFSLFFVSGPCARLIWPTRQLLSARKSTVSYRIVSYCAENGISDWRRTVSLGDLRTSGAARWTPNICRWCPGHEGEWLLTRVVVMWRSWTSFADHVTTTSSATTRWFMRHAATCRAHKSTPRLQLAVPLVDLYSAVLN